MTLVERKSGYSLVRKVKTRHAEGVAAAIIEALQSCKALVHTLTFDNGLEFARHAEIAAALDAKVYFADPYSSWQRGSNENFNGLLRQYFPKRSCFSRITPQRLASVQALLNDRARRRLAWEAPDRVIRCSERRLGVAFAS